MARRYFPTASIERSAMPFFTSSADDVEAALQLQHPVPWEQRYPGIFIAVDLSRGNYWVPDDFNADDVFVIWPGVGEEAHDKAGIEKLARALCDPKTNAKPVLTSDTGVQLASHTPIRYSRSASRR